MLHDLDATWEEVVLRLRREMVDEWEEVALELPPKLNGRSTNDRVGSEQRAGSAVDDRAVATVVLGT